MAKLADLHCTVFRSTLGWMAVAGSDRTLCHVTFGHKTADAARSRIANALLVPACQGDWNPGLRKRLQDYADGAPVDFLDIPVQCDLTTPFALAVLEACRRIPYGETRAYGELAAQVGAPRAARAVGNVMRCNRLPLVVPCHRVVHGDGRIGQFSAPQGASMKRRLLAMEAASTRLTRFDRSRMRDLGISSVDGLVYA